MIEIDLEYFKFEKFLNLHEFLFELSVVFDNLSVFQGFMEIV